MNDAEASLANKAEKTEVRKYITLDVEQGFIEEAQLLSDSGEILAKKAFSINKEEDGTALVFEITVLLQEG